MTPEDEPLWLIRLECACRDNLEELTRMHAEMKQAQEGINWEAGQPPERLYWTSQRIEEGLREALRGITATQKLIERRRT